jgi:glycosyltransferase involved in cell wall biosynthesis
MSCFDEGVSVSLPYAIELDTLRFELIEAAGKSLSGTYTCERTHNRFEVRVQYEDGSSEWFSILAIRSHSGGATRSVERNCFFSISLEKDYRLISFEFKTAPSLNFTLENPSISRLLIPERNPTEADMLLFDVSDLVYYIGHHDNLTGIQRVQACVLLGLIASHPDQARKYITYNNRTGDFLVVDRIFFESLLVDLSLPSRARKIKYDRQEARLGILPNAEPIANELIPDHRYRLVVFLLGAAWVNRDYFHRILELKRAYNALFCMTIHDLIPIFARETCDQGTATVFEEFIRKSFLLTDHYFTVSEYTCFDLLRFASSIGRQNVPVSVIENGHSFDEFFASHGRGLQSPIKANYVLFVSTIEGRKNHSYIFDVWAQLENMVPNLPILVCVGRLGWRAETFLERMLVSGNLNNKIRVMSEVSDSQLEALYENCMFTVYPSTYEGWGLPVGESLSKGKLCVHSDKSSIPEVAGSYGITIDVESIEDGTKKIRRLIEDTAYRIELEERLKAEFVPKTWKKVASELIASVAKIPTRGLERIPTVHLGREYKLAQLPPRNISALGYDMVAQVEGARKGLITGYINRDEDLLNAQAMRLGANWCSPEDWGTWSRYPECEKLFYVESDANISEVVIYEKLRVVGPVVGHTLRVIINDGALQEFDIEDEQRLIRIAGPVRMDSDGRAEVRIRYELKGRSDVIPELDKIDGRRLGLGFESTLIVDDFDLGVRVAMLERMLFGGAMGGMQLRGSAGIARPLESRNRLRRANISRGGLPSKPKAVLYMGGTVDQRSLNAPRVDIGQSIPLSLDNVRDPLGRLLGRGWFPIESSGVWTNGPEATITFRLNRTSEPAFVLSLDMRCLATSDREVIVSVTINNVLLGTEAFRNGDFRRSRHVVDSNICPEDRAFVLLIQCDKTSSPGSVGMETDLRDLGVQLRTLSIEALPTVSLNQNYKVSESSEIIAALASGWYPVEPAGVWSGEEGGRLVAAVNLPSGNNQRNVRMSVVGRIFGAIDNCFAKVDLMVQGHATTSWSFDDSNTTSRSAIVPLMTLGSRSLLDVRFLRRGDIPSPADVELSEDRRRLSLLISEISFVAVDLEANSTDIAIQ